MASLRSEALRCFKNLHKTRLKIFKDDGNALDMIRNHINSEFRKNKNVTDVAAISELIKFGSEVERELRTTVIQAPEVRPGVFVARIHDDTVKLDNISFNESAALENQSKNKPRSPCCNKNK